MTNKEKMALALNSLIVLLGAYGIYLCFRDLGVSTFQFYTCLSNYFAWIMSFLYVLFLLIKKSQKAIPAMIMKLKYASVVCLALTFVTVVAVLAPTMGSGPYFKSLYDLSIRSSGLYVHTLVPIISVLSFSLFEGDRRLNKKKTMWFPILPTLIYGITMIILNIMKIVDGPYPFFRVYSQPIYMTVLIIALVIVFDYVLARFILLFNQMHSSRK